jgi:FixJ family two-component response regulator
MDQRELFDMRLKEMDLAEAATVLIAVRDGVLADSLRFSLELEGFGVTLCDEFSLPRAMDASQSQGCLVVDQDVFARMADGDPPLAGRGIPVVLMVGHKTERVVARAMAAGVTKVVETPLFGDVLFDAIKAALNGSPSRAAQRPS